MLDKYIKINEKEIIVGQTSKGIWYCKELPCNELKDLDEIIGKTNTILNKYNTSSKSKKK